MGLAAGQARLLTITGRKSDCEFESMRLSHQKIALARELADLSNQYQDSLDYTKLVYDYYGTGDTSTPLSYGICMTPSILNDYLPILLTDSMNRAVLDSKYAAAARAAGIPQEGLGTLPSETVRNTFITALGEQNVISSYLVDKITSLPYNQAAGLGGGATVAVITESGTLEEYLEHLKKTIGDTITVTTPCKNSVNDPNPDNNNLQFWFSNDNNESSYGLSGDKPNNLMGSESSETYSFSLKDLITRDSEAMYWQYAYKQSTVNQEIFNATQASVENVIDQFGTMIADTLCLGDGLTEKAFEYATQMIKSIYVPLDADGINYSKDVITNIPSGAGINRAEESVGWTGYSSSYSNGFIGIGGHHSKSEGIVDLGNMLNAYITYFADFMNGISETDAYGRQVLEVKNAAKLEGKYADSYMDDNTIIYTWKTGQEVSSDDLGQATFYDALFNQLCLHGWCENDNVKDNDYLQKMLENGMMYISRIKDDGYYYQGNYATDSYIKVVADERKIAAAEAKYNTEKAKLNAKEQTIDMKMKNLDTEISSLTTEYDTIKNTLSKNIERGFKRYSA